MKLSKIGSVVIFMPFMFQLLLAAVLFALLFQTQEQLLRTARSEAIVKQTNEICMEFMNGLLAFYEANENPVEVARSLTEFHAIERMDAQVQSVSKLLDQAGPRGATSKEIILKVATKARFFLTGILSAIRAGNVDFAMTKMLDAGGFANSLVQDLSKVDAGEKIYELEQERTAMQRRNQIKMVLALAAIAGLIMTCLVAAFCVVHIRRRISQISRNLKLFAARQPLEPELVSEDELALLDVDVHRMDTAVREASERERTLVENAADLICSIDGQGNFQRINAFARRLLGVEPDNLVGRSLFDLVHRDDCAALDASLNQACSEQRQHTFEVRMQHHDKHYIETSWSALWSQSDKSLFCVARDITERKKIERLKDDFLADDQA